MEIGEKRRVCFADVNEVELLTYFREEAIPFPPLEAPSVKGGHIVLITNKQVSGLAKITEKKPTRYGVEFLYIGREENRGSLFPTLYSYLYEEWGEDTSKHLSRHTFLSENMSERIMEEIDRLPNDFGYYLTNGDWLEEEAERKQKQKQKTKVASSFKRTAEDASEEVRLHTTVQRILKEIGNLVIRDVWIAANDQHERLQGETLGDMAMEELPPYPIPKELKKTISLIDVIWFDGHVPTSFFEVECTTSMVSGMLRMLDGIKAIPIGHPNCYIVAPEKRREKFYRELRRPVFLEQGMADFCHFISIEELCSLYEKIKDLEGGVTEDVMMAISSNKKRRIM